MKRVLVEPSYKILPITDTLAEWSKARDCYLGNNIPVSSEAWVRVPQVSFLFFFTTWSFFL